MPRRALAWGLAAATLYVAVAAISFQSGLFPRRPLYDGTAPPEPYRFVDPPEHVAGTNQPPQPAQQTTPFGEEGFPGDTVSTGDQQAFVIYDPDAVEQPAGQTGLRTTIQPLDPDEFGSPPEGLGYEGNAYRVEAVYEPSGAPARLTAPATILLRFPFAATKLFRRAGDRWEELETRPSGGFELFGQTRELGTFVAVGLPFDEPGGGKLGDVLFAAAGFLVVVIGVVLGRWRVVSKKRAQRLRAMGKKAKSKPAPKDKRP